MNPPAAPVSLAATLADEPATVGAARALAGRSTGRGGQPSPAASEPMAPPQNRPTATTLARAVENA